MFKVFVYLLLITFSQLSLALSSSPEGDWKVTNKSCSSSAMEIRDTENIFFRSGFLGHSYLGSEDSEQKCTQLEGFDRIIGSSSYDNDQYLEVSTLRSNVLRTVCRSKKNGKVLSDNTAPLNLPPQFVSIVLTQNNGKIEIKNSSFCKMGVLHLDIQKKKAVQDKSGSHQLFWIKHYKNTKSILGS